MTIGSGIFAEGVVNEKVPKLRKTDEIDRSKRPFAQMCKVFEAREGKKGPEKPIDGVSPLSATLHQKTSATASKGPSRRTFFSDSQNATLNGSGGNQDGQNSPFYE